LIYKFVAILIDGTGVGETTQLVAVGITDDNEKIPVGLIEGTIENRAVVKVHLTSLSARRFTFSADRLRSRCSTAEKRYGTPLKHCGVMRA
jgi:hypothetical protein